MLTHDDFTWINPAVDRVKLASIIRQKGILLTAAMVIIYHKAKYCTTSNVRSPYIACRTESVRETVE